MKRYTFSKHNLPITFDYKHFGKLIKQEDNKYVVKLKGSYIGTILEFIYTNNKCEVEAKVGSKLYYKYIDEFDDPNDFATFSRFINNKKYFFKDSKLIKIEKYFD